MYYMNVSYSYPRNYSACVKSNSKMNRITVLPELRMNSPSTDSRLYYSEFDFALNVNMPHCALLQFSGYTNFHFSPKLHEMIQSDFS